MLNSIRLSAKANGIRFDVTFDDSVHDRSISTDTGWLIQLGRGLDFFKKPDDYSLGDRHQAFRRVQAFSVTYLRP